MKTYNFPLQKKLKGHLMHNPPPIFVGNFRTCQKLQGILAKPASSMVTRERSMCINIYDLSFCLHA